ncbi:MAG: hypothetical protein KAS36_05530, partial [Anaerolineales bacterium]|nr:hypothetical protein [Anaerolineales bacterium]
PDNGKTVTHAMGWDMEVKLRYSNSNMKTVLTGSSYNSAMRTNSPTIVQIPGQSFGYMAGSFSELKGKWDLQSSIMFALGEWFDGVQAQVSTPSIFKSIDRDGTLNQKGKGYLSKPLKLIVPFENAFDGLDLPKKLLKQLIDPKTGLLAVSNNPRLKSSGAQGAEDWQFNTPMIIAYQLACGKGVSYTNSDREKQLKYFYNQGSYLQQFNDPAKKDAYSGARPFRYYGYPQSTILGATKFPASALSTAEGQVSVAASIDDYKYSNNGSAPQWQTISDPAAIITFTDKVATPLWIIRSLSQYGTAKKVSSRMRVAKIKNIPVAFPNAFAATSPDYGTLGYWTNGQSSPTEFANILTAIVEDPSPTMNSQLGAAPKRGSKTGAASKTKPTPSATLTASKGAKPKPPKRVFSPEGVKVTISDFKQGDTFPMGKSWLVLNITPDQAIYNKVMKSWEAGQVGAMSGNRKFTPPKDYIKQYPKIVQLAFKAGTTLLINTNGKTKPEWKEYKWDRDKDVTTVNQNSTFTFIDEDPLKGISFHLRTNNMGSIVIKMTYDDAGNAVTTVDEWFKEGVTELKVEVGPGKGSMILPINVVTTSHSPDVIPMMLIDTNMALEWYQRSLLQYPVKETTADTYPDAWTVFGSEVEIDYFNADSLVQKNPLMFQAIPFDPSTATELDMTKEFLELTLFVKSNTDTYTGFDYSLQEYKDEKIVFPCDERFLSLESITTDPATGDVTKTLIQPSNVRRGNGIKAIWLSAQEDQVKIEFKSGETIIMPDEINRGFSAIEDSNQQQLTGLITRVESHPYPYGRATGPKELKDEMVSLRTVKNIPLPSLRRQSYEDSAGAELLAGTGGLIYEDEDKNVNVILPNPDPDKGLITFKLIWLREA